jgi:urease accessory protein
VVDRQAGRSVVRRAFAESPLRLLTPRNKGLGAWIFTSTFGGGLVGGDRIDLSIDVGPDAMTFLSSQASTKVYRSTEGCRSDVRARVAPGGLLVSMPDPVVCFAGSGYEQVQEFALEAGASLVALDWLSSGRRARGERWAFDRYRSTLRVRAAGRLVCLDRTTLDAGDGTLAERLGRFEVLATLVLAGPRVADLTRRLLDSVAAGPLPRQSSLLRSTASLAGGGCLVRLAGTALEPVAQAVRACLETLPQTLGDDPWARKW